MLHKAKQQSVQQRFAIQIAPPKNASWRAGVCVTLQASSIHPQHPCLHSNAIDLMFVCVFAVPSPLRGNLGYLVLVQIADRIGTLKRKETAVF